MTSLQITPNWKNKAARFKGTVAAGEHVAVSIQNDDGYVESAANLRLRVVDQTGRTLAVFPQPVEEGETSEEWDNDLSPLRCELNLNTVQMLLAVPPAATVPLLFVLDNKEADTLYFKDWCDVTHWPMEKGEDVPYDLKDYPDFVEEAKEAIAEAQNAIESAVDEATGIVEQAKEARSTAQTAASNAADSALLATNAKNSAQNAQTAAETAQGKAETAQEAAETAQGKAEDAQAAAETAQEAAEAALPLDTTLSNSGKAADAKAVGDALTLKADASSVYSKSEVDAKVTEEAQARAASDALKADKATTYTKTEVDTKVAAVQTFDKKVVAELPDAEAADYKTIYLVPRPGGETSDLCDEWTVVGDVGARRWEKIGGGMVLFTFDNAVTRTSVNGVKSSGIWSAIWGALSALPTGFVSLYDWVVSQLNSVVHTSGDEVIDGNKTFARAVEIANGKTLSLSGNSPGGAGYPVMILSRDGINWAGSLPASFKTINFPSSSGTLALLEDMYAAVQQIAPAWVSGTTYNATAKVSYDGVVYARKTSGSITSSTNPATDTTNWKAKKVSDLFLSLTGGTMTGELGIDASAGIFITNSHSPSPPIENIRIRVGDDGKYYIITDIGNNSLIIPKGVSGTLALLADTMRFSTSVSYAVGDVVFYSGSFWRCTTEHTVGAWNASHFEEVIGGLSTGTPTAPTPTSGDDSTKVATTAFVKGAVAGATPNLDYVMRVNPETGEIYYTTPDTNANA